MANPSADGASSSAPGLSIQPPDDIVIPPIGVRDGVAKTADFLHRRGEHNLEGMRARTLGDPKSLMSFILEEDPYHPYFQWYLQQLREGNSIKNSAKQVVQDKPQGPPEPPKFDFSARMPNISGKDLEVVRATALQTARTGENWLKDLRNRQAGNPRFEWLRPNHSFFQYFRSLVAHYKLQIEDEQAVEKLNADLHHNAEDSVLALDHAELRSKYLKNVSAQKEKEEKRAEDEKREYASIDWHDFSVIATVVFDDIDEQASLPAPALLNDLKTQSLDQKAVVSLSRRLDEAMPDESTYYNATQQYPSAQPGYGLAPPVQPTYGAYVPPPMDYKSPAERAREEEQARLAQRQQAEDNLRARAQAAARSAPGRIVTDYVPRAAARKTNVMMALCPNCKQQIPSDELQEHIRIELLDPRWKSQREKADARYATTINTADVANNLKRFASQRDDIYDGATGQPISAEEEARRKKAAVSYNGQPAPGEMQNMNVQEQIRRLHEKHRH